MSGALRLLDRPAGILGALAVLFVALLALPGFDVFGLDRPLLVAILGVLVFAYAWNPVGGVLGEFSVAHLVFWGAGGYVLILASNAGWPLVLTLATAAVLGSVLALVVIAFASAARLDGLYLMVFSLVFLYFAIAVAREWHWIGGAEGVAAIALPLDLDTLYILLAAYAVILIGANVFLLRSRRGLAWLAIADDPERVAALGWSRNRERGIAYVVTGAMCGVGGALATAALGFAGPEISFGLGIIMAALLAVYVGGPGTAWGPLLGVVLFEGLAAVALQGSTDADAALTAKLIQYSVALLLVVALLGGGRGGLIVRRRASLAPVRGDAEPAPVAAGPAQPSGPLELDSIAKSFGGLEVLRDVTMTVQPGEVVGLLGPNGAGKSTICNVVAGTIRPTAGEVRLGGRRVDSLPDHARARLGLGRTFQTPKVFPTLSLAENVAIVAGADVGSAAATTLLESLGVADPGKLGKSATLMERRMVEIGRLMVARPSWALFDEPLAGLTATEQDLVLDHVRDFAESGVAVVIIEHLVPVIAPRTDRICVLDGGKLITEGDPEEVLRDPRVIDAYLGQPVTIEAVGS